MNITLKRKVALFQDMKHDYSMIVDYYEPPRVLYRADTSDEEYAAHIVRANIREGYVQVSDWVTIDFPPLDRDIVVLNAHQTLDKEEAAARKALNNKLSDLADRRAQLLQLAAPEPKAAGTEETPGESPFTDDIPF